MSLTVPRRLLLISSIDHDRIAQSSDRARAEWYAARGSEVVLLYRPLNYGRRPIELLRDSLSLKVRRWVEGGAEFWCVDPPLNYCAGFSQPSGGAAPGRPGGWRARLAAAGLLRDLCAWPTLIAVALLRLRGRYDVALGSGPYGGLVAWVLCRLRKARLFVYLDRDYEPDLIPAGLRRRLLAGLERFLISRADVSTCVGRRLARLRGRHTGRAPVLLHNGVAFERFAAARQRTQRTCNVVYVGALFAHSGLANMLAALPEILRRHPQTRLTIVGDGPDAARLRTLVDEHGLGAAVRFCGPQPYAALPGLLVDAALGLALAERTAFRRYACPLKLLEYAAAGVPTLTTVGTEAGDLVRRHGCGVAVPNTPGALAAAVIRLFDDREQLEALRRGGVAFAAEHTWDRVLTREAELIRAARPACPTPARTVRPLEGRT